MFDDAGYLHLPIGTLDLFTNHLVNVNVKDLLNSHFTYFERKHVTNRVCHPLVSEIGKTPRSPCRL